MADWEVKKLGDVCEVITKGTTPTSIGFKFTNEGINFIKVESLTESGKIIPKKVAFISDECHQALKRSQLKVDDILFSIAGALGRIGIVSEEVLPANTNQALAIIRLQKNTNLLVNFLLMYFRSKATTDQIEKFRGGVAQQNLSLGQLKDLQIPVPPPTEQKRIVAILDEAFESIAKAKENAEKNLKNTKDVFESYLQSVFENKGDGWEEKKLGKIANFEYGYTAKSKENGDFRYVRITDIDSEGSLTNTKKVYLTSSTEAMNFIVQNNDLLMARTGATFAKVLLYEDLEPSIFASYLIRIKFKDKIENKFYWYFSKSRFYWDQANKLVSGSAQPHFNGNALGKMIFSYPKSLSEQELMIKEFDKLSQKTKKLETIYIQKLADLEELKNSILAKAFNGELTEASA